MAEAQSSQRHPEPAALSAAQSQTPHKRNHHHRNRKNSQALPQNDGTVSDSVAMPFTSPNAKRMPKQRHQSIAVASPPLQNGYVDKADGTKERPASLGGNMLLATPAKEQAYAGPTFQASPAPSSLPVPKFFSRSVPNVAEHSLAARMEGEKTPEKEDSSPEPDVVSPHPPPRSGQKSPLDMFFNADRAEKEKSRSGSGSMLSPQLAARPLPPATEPRKVQQFDKNIFLQELDGSNGAMTSPKTVPNKQRQFPHQRPTSSPNMIDQNTDGESEREAQTRALKELIFNNVSTAPQRNSTPPFNQQTLAPTFESPSPFQRSSSGPSTPTPSAEQQNHYSLHYGNRNLSPLFKAARNDSRPSGLRQQELATDMSPPTNYAPHEIDPNSFSRNYINQQIRASGPPEMPQLPLTPGVNPKSSSFSSFGPPSSQQGVAVPASGNANGNGLPSESAAAPRTTATSGGGSTSQSRDLQGMENDLRRMLNLNVLSN